MSGSYSGMVVSIKETVIKYESGSDKYLKRTETRIGDELFLEDGWVFGSDVITPDEGNIILSACSHLGGSIVSLSVVRGSFLTCKMAYLDELALFAPGLAGYNLKSDSSVWMGSFPIDGVAKIISDDVSLEVVDFFWAN
jgi:hypothetical protein